MKFNSLGILFIIPHAGGNYFSMRDLKEKIDFAQVEVLELPGRGRRLNEELLADIDAMVDDLYAIMAPILKGDSQFYILGHSMGAVLGYLLSHRIRKELKKEPNCLFVSGRGGPSYSKEREVSHLLPSFQFRERLRQLGGCPEEVLSNQSIMDFFEPIIKSDFKAVENYIYEKREPLNTRIIGFFGSDEDISLEEMLSWQNESSLPIEIKEYSGDHFFIFKSKEQIILDLRQYISLF